MDTYGSGFAVLWVAIWEMIGLMWIYGVKNVSNDFKLMLGSPPSIDFTLFSFVSKISEYYGAGGRNTSIVIMLTYFFKRL
jgi:hypothetical protein